MVTTDEFIRRAILVHGDKYCYDQVVYINSYSNVDIVCKCCSCKFSQMTKVHLKGAGCRCQMNYQESRRTTQQFLEMVKKIHGETYDYSLTEYKGYRSTTIIICQDHGQFEITASSHLTGAGCPKCADDARRAEKLASFIQKAQKIHGDVYDYSSVVYTGALCPVEINCQIHGIFKQLISNHLKGKGCMTCAHEEQSRIRRRTNDDFIRLANEQWKSFYDYSQTSYTGCHKMVTVICPDHGIFQTKARIHLAGHTSCIGCQQRGFNGYSKKSIRWLEKEASERKIFIQHAENIGEFAIPGTAYHADGFHKESNTIFEYLGAFFHGDPQVYARDFYNKLCKCTMGDLHDKTMRRAEKLRNLGYTVVLKWEAKDD